jgi:hypothetical protein
MKNQAVDYLIGVVSPLRRKLSHSKMPEEPFAIAFYCAVNAKVNHPRSGNAIKSISL